LLLVRSLRAGCRAGPCQFRPITQKELQSATLRACRVQASPAAVALRHPYEKSVACSYPNSILARDFFFLASFCLLSPCRTRRVLLLLGNFFSFPRVGLALLRFCIVAAILSPVGVRLISRITVTRAGQRTWKKGLAPFSCSNQTTGAVPEWPGQVPRTSQTIHTALETRPV